MNPAEARRAVDQLHGAEVLDSIQDDRGNGAAPRSAARILHDISSCAYDAAVASIDSDGSLRAERGRALRGMMAALEEWREAEASTTAGAGLSLKRLLEGDPPAPPRMHIDGFLLAADVNVFGGDGDAGKSTSAFATAVATVTGRPLFGSLRVPRPGPVVLVVPEDGEAVARHHVEALVAGLDVPLSNEEHATLVRDLHIIGDEKRVNLLTDTATLARLVSDIRPALLVADPVSDLIGDESENDEQVANAVCSGLRSQIARPFGTAVLLAAHLRKPREGSDKRTVHDIAGSKGWGNHARMVWTVAKPKGEDVITFSLAKSNRLQTGTEHQIKLAIQADPGNAAHWLSCRLTDANLGASSLSFTPGVGRRVNENERKALEAMDDKHEPGLRLSFSGWFSRSGIANQSTFKNVLRRLLDAELASAVPTGKKARNGGTEYAYIITEGGRRALETGWNR